MSVRFLLWFDKVIRNFLIKNANVMPIRFCKMVALFYADAQVRKIYLARLGVILAENSFTNFGLQFTPNDDFSECVIVGKNCSIAPGVTFLPNSEPNNSDLQKKNIYVNERLIKLKKTIIIEDDCWLGANCVIMPGVTVKKGCIIGAGAVVTKDTEEFGVYAGVPARLIRKLES